MKNFKLLSIVLGLLVGVSAFVLASGLTRPRKAALLSYTATGSLVHAGPGAVYQVTLSTGASTEFVILVDSGSATGVVAAQTTKLIAPRIVYSSATQNTVVNFDPPLLYVNGLVVIGSAATGQAAVTYESGRAIGGN